jgi:hypothetical protein
MNRDQESVGQAVQLSRPNREAREHTSDLQRCLFDLSVL